MTMSETSRAGNLQLADRLPSTMDDVSPPPTSVGGTIIVLVGAILLFWGCIGTWAVYSSIQSAVVATGSFKVDGSVPVVQHLEGGIVKTVRVEDGQQVKAGDILLELADTVSSAQDGILVNQLVSALAQDRRLSAEAANTDTMDIGDELSVLTQRHASFAEIIETQEHLLTSNNAMWRGQVAILENRLQEQKQQLGGLVSQQDTQRKRLALVQDELRGLLILLEKGLIPKTQIVARQDAEAALMGDNNYIQAQIDGLRERMLETQEQILQVHRERERGLSTERQRIKAMVFDVRQRLLANQDVRERLTIRAPVSGRVMDLKFTSVGEVIGEGEDILKVVPDHSEFIVEGKVRPNDIDQVVEGAAARVRLTAYNFRTTPPVEGIVAYVSPDSLVDSASGQPYFKVKVRVPGAQLAQLDNVQVSPGMPAQLMIATGEQTVANYLVGPLWSGLDTALRESD